MPEEGLDFDLNQDYLPTPLVPGGTYKGAITKMSFSEESQMLSITATLNGNGGFCSDETTEIDGTTVTQRVWYPKGEDKETMTGSGRQTKWQWKVNQIKKVADKLKINLDTRQAMYSLVDSQELIGLDVNIKLSIEPPDDYNDEAYNDVKSMEVAD